VKQLGFHGVCSRSSGSRCRPQGSVAHRLPSFDRSPDTAAPTSEPFHERTKFFEEKPEEGQRSSDLQNHLEHVNQRVVTEFHCESPVSTVGAEYQSAQH
jgi:hypothetical protein